MIIIHLLLLHLSINAHRPTDQLTYTGMDGLELIHLPACNQHLHHHHNNKGEHKHKISCAMPFPTSKTLDVAPSASSIARKRLSVSLSLSDYVEGNGHSYSTPSSSIDRCRTAMPQQRSPHASPRI